MGRCLRKFLPEAKIEARFLVGPSGLLGMTTFWLLPFARRHYLRPHPIGRWILIIVFSPFTPFPPSAVTSSLRPYVPSSLAFPLLFVIDHWALDIDSCSFAVPTGIYYWYPKMGGGYVRTPRQIGRRVRLGKPGDLSEDSGNRYPVPENLNFVMEEALWSRKSREKRM